MSNQAQFVHLWAVLLLVVLISPTGRGQSPSVDPNHRSILKGIDELYHFEFDSALTTFDGVIQRAPSDVRGYFFKGMVHFWIFNMNRDRAQFTAMEDLFAATITRAEEILDRDEENAVASFYLGGAYGFRGLAHQRNGSLWDAVWDGRKGFTYLEEAIEMDSTLYDAHMGFGLFRFLVAKVPASFRWILSILGFSGDVEGGLQSLKIAAERGTYTRTEAAFFLAQFLFLEDRTDEAFTYFTPLLERYPDNPVFQLAYAGWQYQLENLAAAKASVENAIAVNERKKITFGDELAYSMRYQIAFIENDFIGTKENILISIERSENKENISNTTYYRLGLSYEFLGRRDSALIAYRNVREVDDGERAYDTYAYRKAQQRLRRPLSDIERSIIRAGNDLSARKYEEALQRYTAGLTMLGSTIDDRAEALYGLMRVHYELEHDQDVVRVSRQLLILDPPRERWCIPHGYAKLGQAFVRLGDIAHARTAYEMAEEYDDYDFEISLKNRVDRELRLLKEK